MIILNFLQVNAQWMCAVAMAFFTIVQIWIMRTQTLQQIRFRRLDLARELNKVFAHYPYDKDTCTKMMYWLMANKSAFFFILKKKDVSKYWQLADFVFERQSTRPYDIGDEDTNLKFFSYVVELENVLGNAKYGISSDRKIKHEKKTK